MSMTLSKDNIEKRIDPLKDGISGATLVRVSGSDIDIVNAARVSYGKCATELTEKDTKLIRFLLEHHHDTPFEHNQLSFRIKAPIFVVRQWMRHRMNSYNEISYRYVKSALEFYTPQEWRFQDTVNKQASVGVFLDNDLKKTYLASLTVAAKTYEELLAGGVCREIARAVLPLCTYTEFIYTCNLRSLLHFLELRLHKGAQKEIQLFAQSLLYLAMPHFPIVLSEWKRLHLDNLECISDTFTPAFTSAVEK
jgi:thymidylate synthase (FAD)